MAQPGQVSAFAVYRNLIPGVKSYEDHNSQLYHNKKKKHKKVKLENGDQQPLLQSPKKSGEHGTPTKSPAPVQVKPTAIQQSVAPQTPPTSPKKRNRKKNKGNKGHSTTTTSSPIQNGSPGQADAGSVVNFITQQAANIKQKTQGEKDSRKRKKAVRSEIEIEVATITSEDDEPVIIQNGVQSDSEEEVPKQKKSKKKQQPKELELAVVETPTKIPKSGHSGKNSFKWLIHPTTIPDFFSNYWEKKPLLVKRAESPGYYNDLLTSGMLDKMMRENNIRFGKNIDVTSYSNGERETHNPAGRAMPPVVWDYYENGCSIRVLNPQTYIPSIWKLNSSLQDYVGTFVGANVYLTPKNSQGFAPHWDDIEAFVLQLEGSKRWKVYAPLEKLPKASSANLKEDIIGKPILDVTLVPGDLLYFPRGFIHQAKAGKQHSLHITISCFQNNSYSDFLKEYLPMALDHATMESVAHREGLPLDYLQYMGVAHADREDLAEKRATFINKIKELASGIITDSIIDFAADQMGKRIIWDSLPPFLEGAEIRTTVSSDTNFTMRDGTVETRNEVDLETEIRLLRGNCTRLVIEEGCLRLYYSTENSLEYHGEEAQFIEMVEEAGPAVEYLIAQFPKYTKIEDLPVESDELKLQIASDLWEKGILRTKV